MDMATTMRSRRSVRGFVDTPMSRETIEQILDLARLAPSGSNYQPWKMVYVCTGEVKLALSRELLQLHYAGGGDHSEEYHYYPQVWREPYLGRRRELGWGLYSLLSIGRQDKDKMMRQLARNYEFFGAPVVLFFSIDRDMEYGGWLETGMFIYGVIPAASSRTRKRLTTRTTGR